MNECGQCPQFVHSREIFIIKMILIMMTDYEAIMLAGIPNAPSVYAPTKNPELAKQRQKQVINKMIEYKYLTQSPYNCFTMTPNR